jgi:hypothetical protein
MLTKKEARFLTLTLKGNLIPIDFMVSLNGEIPPQQKTPLQKRKENNAQQKQNAELLKKPKFQKVNIMSIHDYKKHIQEHSPHYNLVNKKAFYGVCPYCNTYLTKYNTIIPKSNMNIFCAVCCNWLRPYG